MDLEHRYQQQARHNEQTDLPSRFTNPDSVDNWRHTRMLESARALYQALPDAKWMTIGDGRYGCDAAYLRSVGLSVLATNITDQWLRAAHEMGLIDAYQVENAEHLSLDDDAVDFVLCKESYHHFPRPPIALYEMLRVARQGVVLIEPIDQPRLLDGVKRVVKRVIRGDRQHQFEPSGNFLYRVSLRELEKLLLALGTQVYAFRGINDFYHPRLADSPAQGVNAGNILTRVGIGAQDALVRLRLLGYGLACIVVFKKTPDDSLLHALAEDGFRVVHLPRNPYIDS
jgi:SAM-dependent methyltransferase